MNSFGERLRKLRIAKKLKQEELGALLSISKSAVGMYERNEREPSFEIVEKISEVFDVSLDYLLTGSEGKKKKDNGNLFFFDMEGLTEEEIDDIKRHIEYIKWKSEQERRR